MKKTLWIIAILFMIFPSLLMAADKWTTQDVVLEVSWQIVHALDWGTTLDIASHPRMYEMNPILGEHPDRGRINAYMALGAVLHPLVTHFLPAKYRVYWQAVSLGMSGACVINNFEAGLSLRF